MPIRCFARFCSGQPLRPIPALGSVVEPDRGEYKQKYGGKNRYSTEGSLRGEGSYNDGAVLRRRPAGAAHHTRDRKPGYRIENVQSQCQLDYWIPANLHIPTSTPGPFPAVVLQPGHFNAERMSTDCQQMFFDRVPHGFVVLAFDPIGQGDRRQHYEPGAETFDETLSPTLEHGMIGALLSLIGESAAGYFVSKAMRAVDYLLTRWEVHRARIGRADHTDAGWSALYHAVVDERIQCLAMYVHGPRAALADRRHAMEYKG